MSLTSAWLPKAANAKPGDMGGGWRGGTDCINSHGSQVSSQSGAVPWTTDTNAASGSIEDHSGPSWR